MFSKEMIVVILVDGVISAFLFLLSIGFSPAPPPTLQVANFHETCSFGYVSILTFKMHSIIFHRVVIFWAFANSFGMELIWFGRSVPEVQCQYLFNLCKAAVCLPYHIGYSTYFLFPLSKFSNQRPFVKIKIDKTECLKVQSIYMKAGLTGLKMGICKDEILGERKYESHQCQGLHLRGFSHKKRSRSEW